MDFDDCLHSGRLGVVEFGMVVIGSVVPMVVIATVISIFAH